MALRFVPITTFIGRDADLTRLRELFDGGARLVTLFGPAGIGKTRLAMRYAQLRGDAPVCVCELAAATTLEDVCRVVARAANVPIEAKGDDGELVERFVRTLTRETELLVVVDNCEQVATQVAALLSRWCTAAPSIRFLATSRELLGVAGECAVEVGPLSLPRDGSDLEAEAVRLFVDRARLIRSDYTIEVAEAPAVAELVRQLDGLPLAIELAAGWSDVFHADALLARLPRRLDEFPTRTRTAVDRQRTLRAAIDGSWLALEEWEKAALAQSAVFRGGFSLESAETVLDLSRFPGAPPTAQVIASLRVKSLVRTFQPDAHTSQPRLALYESIRVFADEKLDASGHRAEVDARHTSHFAGVATAALRPPAMNVTEHDRGIMRDLDNLLAVHARALAGSPAMLVVAAHIALALERPLGRAGLFPRLLDALEAVLAHAELERLDIELVARVRVARVRVRGVELVASRAEIEEVLAFARKAGSLVAEGTALGLLASQDFLHTSASAVPAGERALDALRRGGDVSRATKMMILLSYAEHAGGHARRARQYSEEAVAAAEAAGDLSALSEALTADAFHLLIGEHLDRALASATRGEDAARRVGSDGEMVTAAILAAQVLQEQGRFAEARLRYERAQDVHRTGFLHDTILGRLYGYMGTLEHETGNWSKAEERYQEGLLRSRRSGFRACEMCFASALGALEATRDRLEEAARLLDAAEERLAPQDEQGFATVFRLHRGHVDLAQARARERAGDATGAARLRAEARGRLAGVAARYPSEDVRFARRLLERALVAEEERARFPEPRRRGTFVVHPEGRWFVLPTGKRHTVPQKPMRLLLVALARHTLLHPGVPLSSEELIRQGWPGDKALPAAANLRLRVTLSRLRAAGLRTMLHRSSEGYALKRAVAVVIDEDDRGNPGTGT